MKSRVLATWLLSIFMMSFAGPASARIIKTKLPHQGARGLPLTIGGGFEFETDPEESEYGYSFLAEYEVTNRLKLAAEPSYVQIRSKPGEHGTSVSGPGDFETTLEFEFLSMRRHRPALTAQGIVKWPTATHIEVGTRETDYSVGLIASYEFVGLDLETSALYTFVGSPPGLSLQNETEFSVAAEWRFHPSFDLEAEVVTSTGGGIRGQSGTLGGLGGRAATIGPSETLTEGTLGLATHLNEFLKLEAGVVAKSDGAWQGVFAWEWDFGGR